MGHKVNIDGYLVDLDEHDIDMFFSGKDGTRVTDAEWDESKRRIAEAEASDAVTWTVIN